MDYQDIPLILMERAKTLSLGEYLTLKILDPVDFVFSKLMRGTEEDLQDIMDVIRKFNISKESLGEREKLIQFPKDPETLLFKKKFQHLMELMKKDRK
ncbi:MAG TPA: hypothetical protein VJ024_00150 [Thermodesulfovibrionales bacterium]|nr:hypothetical protein [Thermodesulfovibrionales bacterium]